MIPELKLNIESIKEKIKSEPKSIDSAFAELDSAEFQYLHYSHKQLKECIFEIFSRLGLLSRFQIDHQKLRNLIKEIYLNYNRVPYHNFTHAFNIIHMSYYILRTTKLRDNLEDIEVLALMVGALGHDIDH